MVLKVFQEWQKWWKKKLSVQQLFVTLKYYPSVGLLSIERLRYRVLLEEITQNSFRASGQ